MQIACAIAGSVPKYSLAHGVRICYTTCQVKNMKKAAIYSIFAIAAVCLWFATHSETAKIKRVFSSFEKIASCERQCSVLESAAKARAISRFFKDGCAVVVPELGVKSVLSREDIAGAMLGAFSSAKNLRIRFLDLKVSVDGDTAQAEGTVEANGAEAMRMLDKRRQFIARLEKADGQWLVSRIEVPQ